MCQLFESIRVVDGEIKNLYWHQLRFDKSCNDFFEKVPVFNLSAIDFKIPEKGLSKLRFSYNSTNYSYRVEPYFPKQISSLKLVFDNEIDYSFKFDNREKIGKLSCEKGDCDDILIVKNGFISDSSFANILFFDGEKWITPSTPLLYGTCRARLLFEKKISEKEIKPQDLKLFKSFMLINAMRDFDLKNATNISEIKM